MKTKKAQPLGQVNSSHTSRLTLVTATKQAGVTGMEKTCFQMVTSMTASTKTERETARELTSGKRQVRATRASTGKISVMETASSSTPMPASMKASLSRQSVRVKEYIRL